MVNSCDLLPLTATYCDLLRMRKGMARGSAADDYLVHHHILTYIEDATSQLLRYKGEVQSKIDINRFFAQYFTCLKDGKHAMLREFEFINSTPYNRACFIETFLRCFVTLGKKGDLLSIRDYYALVSLICNDFPYEILQKTAKIVLIDDAHDCLISFTDFIYSFQLQLYYQEFLETSYQLYQSLLTETHSPRDIVVPTDHTTEIHKEKQPAHNTLSAEGIDSMKFFRSLSQLQDKNRFSIPSLAALKEILSASPTTTFYGFLVALSKSEAINNGIGKLPASTSIFDGVELNLTDQYADQYAAIPNLQKSDLEEKAPMQSIPEVELKSSSLKPKKSDSINAAPKTVAKGPLRCRTNSTDSSSDADSSESDST